MELLIGSILAGVGLGWIAVPHCYGMCVDTSYFCLCVK